MSELTIPRRSPPHNGPAHSVPALPRPKYRSHTGYSLLKTSPTKPKPPSLLKARPVSFNSSAPRRPRPLRSAREPPTLRPSSLRILPGPRLLARTKVLQEAATHWEARANALFRLLRRPTSLSPEVRLRPGLLDPEVANPRRRGANENRVWWRVGGPLRGAAAVGARWARCPLSAFALWWMSALGKPGCPISAPRGPVAECALGPHPHGQISSEPRGFLPARRAKSCPSPSSESLSPPSFSSQIFALLTENRPEHSSGPARPREASPQRLSPADSVFALAVWAAPLQKASRSLDSTGLPTDFTPSEAGLLGLPRPGRSPPAAPPSCSLQSFSSTQSSHTRAQWGLWPSGGLSASPSFQGWLPGPRKNVLSHFFLAEEDLSKELGGTFIWATFYLVVQ